MIQRLAPIFIGVFFVSSLFMPISASADNRQSSPLEAFSKVIEVLTNQANDLKKSLLSLKDLNDAEEALRQQYLDFLNEVLDYYQSLETTGDGSNVKSLAAELKEKRDSVYSSEIKKIGEFILVFQAKTVLRTANSRFLKINNDLNRLEELKILKKDKAEFLLNEAHLLLVGAEDSINKAEELLGTTARSRLEIKDLISQAVSKIKLAYKKFLEISNLLKESLK